MSAPVNIPVNIPVNVYEPYRAGLPPLGEYGRSLWSRRHFIAEFSRSQLREQNYGSFFGQLWLVLNPLLLSGVYFLLIFIIGGRGGADRYVHLTSSLFFFYLISNSLTGGVKSITAGQRLILNTAFPRIMLPISASVIAVFKFVPTLIVFFVIRTIIGAPFSWQMLWSIPIFILGVLMGLGMAIAVSCINVYFRDIASLLPYMTRSLIYLSPILYEASALSERMRTLEIANPIFNLLDAWSQVMVYAQAPTLSSLLISLAWATLILLIGTYFFLSRERDFAVRF
ncbi:MAG: ABC transporter permease [Actinomycetota bacterium]|jgi:teichoic acid transport system permease protein|uniref:ABC transporter permease n=1 Tax=Candidatus Planktophila sp. TaxID=2175601 RepID=UPI0037EF72C2|nr:ABC transporter permease [Actinomycetota bacterium]